MQCIPPGTMQVIKLNLNNLAKPIEIHILVQAEEESADLCTQAAVKSVPAWSCLPPLCCRSCMLRLHTNTLCVVLLQMQGGDFCAKF